jgi:hypothetical protein
LNKIDIQKNAMMLSLNKESLFLKDDFESNEMYIKHKSGKIEEGFELVRNETTDNDFEILSNRSYSDDKFTLIDKEREDVFSEEDWEKLMRDNTVYNNNIYPKLILSIRLGIPEHL